MKRKLLSYYLFSVIFVIVLLIIIFVYLNKEPGQRNYGGPIDVLKVINCFDSNVRRSYEGLEIQKKDENFCHNVLSTYTFFENKKNVYLKIENGKFRYYRNYYIDSPISLKNDNCINTTSSFDCTHLTSVIANLLSNTYGDINFNIKFVKEDFVNNDQLVAKWELSWDRKLDGIELFMENGLATFYEKRGWSCIFDHGVSSKKKHTVTDAVQIEDIANLYDKFILNVNKFSNLFDETIKHRKYIISEKKLVYVNRRFLILLTNQKIEDDTALLCWRMAVIFYEGNVPIDYLFVFFDAKNLDLIGAQKNSIPDINKRLFMLN